MTNVSVRLLSKKRGANHNQKTGENRGRRSIWTPGRSFVISPLRGGLLIVFDYGRRTEEEGMIMRIRTRRGGGKEGEEIEGK